MRDVYASTAIQEADRIASEVLGIPGIVLMENAGRGAAEAILRRYPDAGRMLIVCGPGNNGGDGFVAARHLLMRGVEAVVVSTLDSSAYKGDAAVAADAARRCGLTILKSEELDDEAFVELAEASQVVVDALLGTGTKGAPRGEVLRLVSLICRCGGARDVVSLDIPSGVDPDTGEIEGAAVSARLTVTFHAEKAGLLVAPGFLHAGAVEVAHIGAPLELTLLGERRLGVYDRSDIPALLPAVAPDVHKGARGTLMVVGGSSAFRGAPVLAAKAALRVGCGLVVLAVPEFLVAEASAFLPEAVFLPLPVKDGVIRYKTFERAAAPWLEKCDALALGPGLGRSGEAERITGYLQREWRKPLLLDADALFHLGNLEKISYPSVRRADMLITPHAGEAAHLLGSKSGEVSARRLAACDALAAKFGVALLKGPHTLISDGGRRRVVAEGGPALAVPGSGDVLTGIAGAFLAAGLSCLDAATLGALVHGVAGEGGRRTGLLAREIAERIAVERAPS